MKGIGHKVVVGALALIALVGSPFLVTVAPSAAMPLANGAQAWGDNTQGQLGNGSILGTATPTTIGGLYGITQIATGDHFALALLANGNVVAWGENDHGQLGDGTTTTRTTPVAVAGLPTFEVKEVAAGGHFSLALLKNGTVMAWGDNSNGQLGDGNTTDSSTPVSVTGLTGAYQVQAGEAFGLATLSGGDVESWGANANGQLGDGNTTDSSTPVAIPGLNSLVHLVSAGSDFALALLNNQDVVAWGDNTHGQLGNGTNTQSDVPSPVSGISFVHAIAAGGAHSLAILTLGRVAAWGDDANGQLGDNLTTDSNVPVVLPLSPAYALAAGGSHSLALMRNGTVEAWGANASGQLGDGSTIERHEPVPVPGLSGVTAVSAGANFSIDKGVNLAPHIAMRRRLIGFVDLPLALVVRVHSHPTVATISETGTLPSGITFTDHGNDTASLSGTPAPGSEGSYSVQVSASTAVGGTTTVTLRILIK